MHTPTTLDTLQAIQKDLSLCDLQDSLGRSYALVLIHQLESMMQRYSEVQEAMRRLSSEQFSEETEYEKAFLDALPQETIDAMDAQILTECRGIEAAHPSTFDPMKIFDMALDAVRPKP
jgi:hypothetical protein